MPAWYCIVPVCLWQFWENFLTLIWWIFVRSRTAHRSNTGKIQIYLITHNHNKSPTNTSTTQLCSGSVSVGPDGLDKRKIKKKQPNNVSIGVVILFVDTPSMDGAQQNTPKGQDKHPWQQPRFGVVAPLFITCSVSSMTAAREMWRESQKDRGWPLNSRAEEKTTMFCTFELSRLKRQYNKYREGYIKRNMAASSILSIIV